MIKRLSYKVIVSGGGKEALDLYRAHMASINLVLLDMVMPHMSGGEIFDRIRQMNPHAKVLLCSGYNLDSKGRDILERGCNGFIQKPFDVKNLCDTIRQALKS